MLSKSSEEASVRGRASVGARKEGRRGGFRERREQPVRANTVLIFTLSLCVSCFVGDKITFFKGNDGNGSVLFFFLNLLSWQNKMWETLCQFLEVF